MPANPLCWLSAEMLNGNLFPYFVKFSPQLLRGIGVLYFGAS
jgi:hypothetical protein